MQALFGAFSGPSTSLDVVLTNVDGRLNTRVEGDAAAAGGAGAVAAAPAGMYVYSNGENVEGEARIVVPAGKKLEHVGIRAELKGVVGESVHQRSSEGDAAVVVVVAHVAAGGPCTSHLAP